MMGDEYSDVRVTIDDVREGSVLIEHTLEVDAQDPSRLDALASSMTNKIGTNFTEPYTGNGEFSWNMLSYEVVNGSGSNDALNVTPTLFNTEMELYIFIAAVFIAVCIFGTLLYMVYYTIRLKKRHEMEEATAM